MFENVKNEYFCIEMLLKNNFRHKLHQINAISNFNFFSGVNHLFTLKLYFCTSFSQAFKNFDSRQLYECIISLNGRKMFENTEHTIF